MSTRLWEWLVGCVTIRRLCVFFFFSSRRRHTRFDCDWSSDVCSSDLNFWTDPTTGIPYYLAVQTPENRVSSLNDLGNTPVSSVISSGGVTIPGLLSKDRKSVV